VLLYLRLQLVQLQRRRIGTSVDKLRNQQTLSFWTVVQRRLNYEVGMADGDVRMQIAAEHLDDSFLLVPWTVLEHACHDVMAEVVPTKTVRFLEKFIYERNATVDATTIFDHSLKNAAALLVLRYRNRYTMELFSDELNMDKLTLLHCFLDDVVAMQRFA